MIKIDLSLKELQVLVLFGSKNAIQAMKEWDDFLEYFTEKYNRLILCSEWIEDEKIEQSFKIDIFNNINEISRELLLNENAKKFFWSQDIKRLNDFINMQNMALFLFGEKNNSSYFDRYFKDYSQRIVQEIKKVGEEFSNL